MGKTSTLISESNGKIIEIVNNGSDPNVWIVKVSKKSFFFKKLIRSYWFMSREQAEVFAEKLKNKV